MKRHMGTWVLVITAFASVAAACGGGEETAPSPTITRAAVPPATAAPTTTRALAPTAAPVPTPTSAQVPTPIPTPTATRAPAGPAGKLRVALATFVSDSLDPTVASHGGIGLIGFPIYDYPTWVDKNGDMAPGVAKSWSVSSDGLSWMLQLRTDLRFHNGVPVTSEDVAFTLNRSVREGGSSSYRAVWIANFDKATAASPSSVTVTTKRPWVVFPYQIGPRSAGEAAVYPRAYVEQVGDKGLAAKPIGSGPWRFVEQVTGVRVNFEVAPTQHPYRPMPAYKELELLLAPEESTRVAMLRTGAVDIVETGVDAAVTVEGAGFPVLPIGDPQTGNYVFWGAADPRTAGSPMANVRVREALALAINRQEIINTFFASHGSVAARWMAIPGTDGYDASWKPIPYDVARAKSLLAEQGYGKGFEIEAYSFALGGAPWMPRLMEIIAGYWSAVGITTRLIPVDTAVVLQWYRPDPQDARLIGRVSTFRANISPVYISSYEQQWSRKTLLRWGPSEEFEKLMAASNAEFDSAKRAQILRELVEKTHNLYIAVPMIITDSLFGASKSIQGWSAPRGTFIGAAYETVVPRR